MVKFKYAIVIGDNHSEERERLLKKSKIFFEEFKELFKKYNFTLSSFKSIPLAFNGLSNVATYEMIENIEEKHLFFIFQIIMEKQGDDSNS
jgi:hypothetical protein